MTEETRWRRLRLLLWVSAPIAVGAMAASAAGVFADGTYAEETEHWAAQAVGQDVVNLFVVYPALLAAAWLARRGSLRAFLVWLGLLVYTAYSYLIYAGFVHFSGWFVVYVAVLGMSGFALVAGFGLLDPVATSAAFGERFPRRLAGGWLLGFGAVYFLFELVQVLGAALDGAPPQSAVDTGLVTDPVFLLDMAFMLPLTALAGWLVLRERPVGMLLAGPILSWAAAMGIAVFTMLIATQLRVEDVPAALFAGFAVIATLHAVVLAAVLRSVEPRILPMVLRRPRGEWVGYAGAGESRRRVTE